MKKVFVAAMLIAALMSIGARTLTTVPSLSAPGSVQAGAQLPVKGTGFMPRAAVNVCIADTDCAISETGRSGGFVQSRVAPLEPGKCPITAVQTVSNGPHTRTIKADTMTLVMSE